MTGVDFGLGLRVRHPTQLGGYVREAVDAGFSHIWLYDSPRFAETWVSMTACAMQAQAVTVGTLVTNLETRDPTVTANAVSTLSLLTGGRVMLGIGLGDSAVKFIGRTPTSFDEFRARLRAVQALLRGEAVVYHGRSLRLNAPPEQPTPVLLAAEGPRTFELAGAVADGAIISPGSSPKFLTHAIAKIREGAVRAGRDPRRLYICAQAHCAVAESDEQGITELVGALNRTLFRWVMRVPHAVLGLDRPFVPETLERRARDITSHQDSELLGAAEIRAAMGDDLLQELAIVGTPDRCREKVLALLAVDGLSQLLVNIHARDRTLSLALFHDELTPGTRTSPH